MEAMLGGFQEGLGSISAEIRGLQQQSSALSQQLNNRKSAQVGSGAAAFLGPAADPALPSAANQRAAAPALDSHCAF